MAKKILFVVEGERAETRILISTFKRALDLSKEDYEVSKYKTNIHQLFKNMKSKGYDSFLSYLYSFNKKIFPKDMFTPETAFSSVYLFFDLDPQDKLFSIDETLEIASFFNDETQNGKLYISYPMVESLFDFDSFNIKNFYKKIYPISNLSKFYKHDARVNSFLSYKYKTASFSKIKDSDIYSICILHMKKYCHICGVPFDKSWKIQSSALESFQAQLSFLTKGFVSVLNCGILLIPDYSPLLVKEVKKLKF